MGHAAEHVADAASQRLDPEVRDYATNTGAIIITKDEDFAVWRLLHAGPSVVWIRVGNTRRVALLGRMEAEFPAIVRALERGETLIEIV